MRVLKYDFCKQPYSLYDLDFYFQYCPAFIVVCKACWGKVA